MNETGLKIFEALVRPFQRLPLGFHYAWGRFFEFTARNILHYRTKEVMINLARSFPDRKYWELEDIAKGFYRHLGEIFAETVWFGGCVADPGKLHERRLCVIREPEELIATYNRRPGVMLLSSHFGNWELVGGFMQYFYDTDLEIPFGGDDACVVYKKLTSPFWDKFMGHNRCAVMPGFKGYVESRNVLRYALNNRGSKRLYIFLTDQYPYRNATRHEVESFMNQKTLAMTGGAALANKFGMAVFYMSFDRKEKGRYDLRFRKVCEDASSMSPEAIMDTYYGFLQEDVRANPENYLWSHKRWK